MPLGRSEEVVWLGAAAAEDALSRLDERVLACPFRSGFIARRDFAEAVAWSWTQGSVTPLEDLVLHDQGMDARTPDAGLLASHGLVLARRKAAVGGPALLSLEGVEWLAGRRREPPPPVHPPPRRLAAEPDLDAPGLIETLERSLRSLEAGDSGAARAGLGEWLDFIAGLDGAVPATLRVAAMLEAWWIIDPLPRQRYVGGLVTGVWLQAQRRVPSHVVGFETGLRAVSRRAGGLRAGGVLQRLGYWLGVIAAGAREGLDELSRLEIARRVMAQNVAGRRAHARAGDIMDLLLELPVVTAPLISGRLGISQQSARRSLEELGSVVVEISGRSRFRAWRV